MNFINSHTLLPGSPEEQLAEGVNKMGLFTEDLEKADSDAKVPATIVEGPVSPQSPTSPIVDEEPPALTEAEVAPSSADQSPEAMRATEEEPKKTAVAVTEEDDDDLFKEN